MDIILYLLQLIQYQQLKLFPSQLGLKVDDILK